jgi:glycosyltransferase 2 family protein
MALGGALVVASWAEVRRPGIRPREERIFRLANGAADNWRGPVRVVMQAGSLGAVPTSAAVAALAGRRGLAIRLLAGGLLTYFGAKAVKPFGRRERPDHVVERVRIRESIEGELGWISGHTAVSTTLALIAADELPAWAAPLLAGVVATTGFGRMYVGAHLPHDLVGGAGFGAMVSALLPPLGWPDRRLR